MAKNPPANAGDTGDVGSILWVGKSPWRRAWQPTAVFLPGESHGQRGLEGYSPLGSEPSLSIFTPNIQFLQKLFRPSIINGHQEER